MITTVLADDHGVVRHGLRAILEAEADIEVVGEAADGIEAIRLVERLRPHVAVVDISMPAMNGLEVARHLKDGGASTRVILLSMHSSEVYLREALRAGALAFVIKDASAEELVQAVRAVAAGRRYLSRTLAETALEAYAQQAAEGPSSAHERLTERERQVLQLAAEGHTSAEIGARLFLSPRTVETHRASLMRKLGLRTQSDLVRYALKHGILRPE